MRIIGRLILGMTIAAIASWPAGAADTPALCGSGSRGLIGVNSSGECDNLETDGSGHLYMAFVAGTGPSVVEDAAHVGGEDGSGTMCRRIDVLATSTNASGDWGTCNQDQDGAEWVRISKIDAGTNVIGKVGIDQTTPGTTNRVDIGAALPAGTAVIGKFGIDQTTPGTTDHVSAVLLAGTAEIGKLAAGTAAIGTVKVTTPGAAAVAGAGSTTVTADETLVAAVADTRLFYLVIQEDAAGAASGLIRHGVEGGGNCTGNIIGAYGVASGGHENLSFGDRGVAVGSGVCADVTAGSVTISWGTLVEAAP